MSSFNFTRPVAFNDSEKPRRKIQRDSRQSRERDLDFARRRNFFQEQLERACLGFYGGGLAVEIDKHVRGAGRILSRPKNLRAGLQRKTIGNLKRGGRNPARKISLHGVGALRNAPKPRNGRAGRGSGRSRSVASDDAEQSLGAVKSPNESKAVLFLCVRPPALSTSPFARRPRGRGVAARDAVFQAARPPHWWQCIPPMVPIFLLAGSAVKQSRCGPDLEFRGDHPASATATPSAG